MTDKPLDQEPNPCAEFSIRGQLGLTDDEFNQRLVDFCNQQGYIIDRDEHDVITLRPPKVWYGRTLYHRQSKEQSDAARD